MLRAVMHGYYMDARLYNKAKLIANPFDYKDFMMRKVKQKISEENKRGIQTKVNGQVFNSYLSVDLVNLMCKYLLLLFILLYIYAAVSYNLHNSAFWSFSCCFFPQKLPNINREMFERLMEDKEDKSKKKKVAVAEKLLTDDRFGDLFSSPDFQIDKDSVEFK